MIKSKHNNDNIPFLSLKRKRLAGNPGRITAKMDLSLPREQRDQPYLQEQAAQLAAILVG